MTQLPSEKRSSTTHDELSTSLKRIGVFTVGQSTAKFQSSCTADIYKEEEITIGGWIQMNDVSKTHRKLHSAARSDTKDQPVSLFTLS